MDYINCNIHGCLLTYKNSVHQLAQMIMAVSDVQISAAVLNPHEHGTVVYIDRGAPDGESDSDSDTKVLQPTNRDRPEEQPLIHHVPSDTLYDILSCDDFCTGDTWCCKCRNCNDLCTLLSCRINILSRKMRLRHEHREMLRLARTRGWTLLWNAVIPTAVEPILPFWLISQLLAVFVLLGLSIAVLVSGRRVISIIDWCQLGVSILLMLLTVVDALCYGYVRNRCTSLRNCCETESGESAGAEAPRLIVLLERYSHVPRLLYMEICVLVLLIAERSTSIDTNDTLRFVRFVFAVVVLGLSVYLPQLLLVTCTIVRLQKLHEAAHAAQPGFFQLGRSFMCCQVWFLITHILGQIALQVIQYILLYQEAYAVHIVPLFTFALPLLDTLIFFFINFFWFQEFLIGIYIDFATLLSSNRAELAQFPQDICRQLENNGPQFADIQLLSEEFDQFCSASLCSKFLHTFESPFSFIFLTCLFTLWGAYFIMFLPGQVPLRVLIPAFSLMLNAQSAFILPIWAIFGIFYLIFIFVLVPMCGPFFIILILWCCLYKRGACICTIESVP